MKATDKGRSGICKYLGIILGVVLFCNQFPFAFAEDVYPSRKIIWVIHTEAGGGYDVMARGIVPYLTDYLSKRQKTKTGIVIKNIPGAAGRKAYSSVYLSKSDGYTIGTFDPAFFSDTIFEKMEYDFTRLTFLCKVMSTSRVLVANKHGLKSWKEMIDLSKERPLKWAVAAFGRANHLGSIIIKETVGIQAKLIAHKSANDQINSLLRGDIDIAMVSEDGVSALVEAGELNILATFTNERTYPAVPCTKEIGFPYLAAQIASHRCIIGPPDMDPRIKNILVSAIKKSLEDKEFKTWAKKLKIPLSPLYGQDAERFILGVANNYLDRKETLKKYLN